MEVRQKIVAGNWKMHANLEESQSLVTVIGEHIKANPSCKVLLIPPFTHIFPISIIIEKSQYQMDTGAQNMYFEDKGAFTGEISPLMLNDLGVKYVLIGHSERRQLFNESNATVNLKLIKALSHNLTPILCVGESLDEREADLTDQVVKRQIVASLNGISATSLSNKFIIAYEPVWAIGTGKVCAASEANRVIKLIRFTVSQHFKDSPSKIADSIPILYGGSVKGSNAEELSLQSDIDGALVGGASLIAQDFCQIIKAFS